MLTQARLKELLSYNPETGVFVWIKSRGNAKAMSEAGAIGKPHNYRRIKIDQKSYRAHRLAFLYMDGVMPEFVDHINHDKTNNNWSNLRCVTHKENMQNLKKYKNNKSGLTGVGWDEQLRKWRANISLGGKLIHLGRFKYIFDAACARKSAENRYGFHDNHGI